MDNTQEILNQIQYIDSLLSSSDNKLGQFKTDIITGLLMQIIFFIKNN